MNPIAFDSWIREKTLRKWLAITTLIWVAFVIGLAIYRAREDGVDLYQRTFLWLLLLGVPAAASSLVYALSLLNKRDVRRVVITVTLGGLAFGAFAGLTSIYRKSQERAQEERNRELAIQQERDYESARKRITQEYRQVCTAFCKGAGSVCTSACWEAANENYQSVRSPELLASTLASRKHAVRAGRLAQLAVDAAIARAAAEQRRVQKNVELERLQAAVEVATAPQWSYQETPTEQEFPESSSEPADAPL